MANAGLLDGHRATGHWFKIDDVAQAHPTMALESFAWTRAFLRPGAIVFASLFAIDSMAKPGWALFIMRESDAQKTIMRLRLEAGPRWAKRLRERQEPTAASFSHLADR